MDVKYSFLIAFLLIHALVFSQSNLAVVSAAAESVSASPSGPISSLLDFSTKLKLVSRKVDPSPPPSPKIQAPYHFKRPPPSPPPM
ncbi:hypothetical protein COLO4_15458 [Corchorus olitorius]|uniref:Uncharacterized protein n=1 Tax=Corchorus olitorius TaxID=93759 RepID=A0A1R3JMS0_9ROSI|nr:hypothetical protein COLO4_15458 [Corchorus olitorius]